MEAAESSSIIGDDFLSVSVIVNVWAGDSPERFRESLLSVENQSRAPEEVVIVVDGPISNDLVLVIKDFGARNQKLKVIQSSVNNGLAKSRNLGVANSSGEFVVLHDADDLMHPERIRIQLLQMVIKDLDICFSPVAEFDSATGKMLGVRRNPHSKFDEAQFLYWNNQIPHSSVSIRRKLICGSTCYRDIKFVEDYDLWLRLVSHGAKIGMTIEILQALGVDKAHFARRSGLALVNSEYHLHKVITSVFPRKPILNWIRFFIRVQYRLGPKVAKRVVARLVTERLPIGLLTVSDFLRLDPFCV